MTYRELKKKHQEEINAFPFMFAFNNEQFIQGMAKLGFEPGDTDKIYDIGGGGFVRKTDYKALEDLIDRHQREIKEAIAADETGDGFIYDMFYYELANHEYIITGDLEPTLNALDLSLEAINSSPALLHGLKKAMAAQNEYS